MIDTNTHASLIGNEKSLIITRSTIDNTHVLFPLSIDIHINSF